MSGKRAKDRSKWEQRMAKQVTVSFPNLRILGVCGAFGPWTPSTRGARLRLGAFDQNTFKNCGFAENLVTYLRYGLPETRNPS